MKKTLVTLLFAVLSGLWSADAWALGHSTHNGSVSVSKVGEGTVYLSASADATSGETSATWSCGGDSSKDSATYYLYAQPAEGWGLSGWSGSGTSTDLKFKVTPNASQNNGTYSYTATFKPYRQYRAKLTCEATEGGEVAIGEAANFATKVSAPEQVSEKSLKDSEDFSFDVHARANANWSFVRWKDASGKELSTTADYTHKVTSAKYGDDIEEVTLIAEFAQSHTYYVQADVYVDENCAAGGLVALSRENKAPEESAYGSEATLTDDSTLADNSATFTYYAFAKCADDWWNFSGWYEGGKRVSTDANFSFDVTTSSEDVANPDVRSLSARFVNAPLVTATCERSAAGSYTVSGTCDTEPTAEKIIAAGEGTDTVALPRSLSITLSAATPAEGYKFRRWWKLGDNGTKVTLSESASVKLDVPADGLTVGVDFIPAGLNFAVGQSYFENFADAVAAAQTEGMPVSIVDNYEIGEDLTIASGVEFFVPASAKLTVSAGVTLTVDGTLMVIGSIGNNGTIAGSGTIAYSYKTITQAAKVNVPYPAGTDGPAGTASGLVACDKDHKAEEVSSAGKYLNTSTSDGATELTGLSLTKKYFVTVVNMASGETFTSSLLDSKPVAIVCTVARDKALNWISGMDGMVSSYSSVKSALDRAKTSSVNSVANYSDSHNWMAVLTENAGTVTYDGGGSSVTFGTIVDLAGKSLTVSASNKTQYNYHAIVRAFNGSISLSQKVMSTKFFLYNCTGSLGYLSGGNQYGTAAYLYDSPNFSVTFKDVVTDSPAGSLNFCGGGPYTTTKVKFQTTPTTKFNVVYAGTFVSGMNPTEYLWDDNKVEAVQDPSSKNWIVQDKYVNPNKGQTLVNGEEHSFAEAFEIAKAGDVIKLQRDVELEEDLDVASGKDVRLDLSGFALSGDFKIVNNGELEIIDCNNGVVPSQVNVQIVNNGTLLLSNAAYNDDITLNKGLCYFLAGSFNGNIVFAADAVPSGIAQVRGGTFAKSVYKQGDGEGTLLSLCENGYTESGKIAQIPNSYIVGPGAGKTASFSIRALLPEDEALVTRVSSYEENRSLYTKDEWIQLMTVRASSSFFVAWNVDCGAKVDRAVESGDLTLGILTYHEDVPAILAGNSASVLLPAMRDSGMATSAWSYSSIGPGGENASKISFTVQGKQVVEGTSIWMEMRLVRSLNVLTQPKDWSYSGPYVVTGSRRFVVGATTNKAMVWGESGGATFYSTLDAAVAADATSGKTIKLCNDCTEKVTVSKVCTIDTNGFAFTGEITAGEGFALTVNGDVYTVVAKASVAVADVDGEPYETIEEAVAAAIDKATSGGETPTVAIAKECEIKAEDVPNLDKIEVKVPEAKATELVVTTESALDASGKAKINSIKIVEAYQPEEPITIAVQDSATTPTTPITVTKDWVDKNVTPAGQSAPTKDEVEAALAQKQTNGYKGWQNYLMGIDGTKKENTIVPVNKPVAGDASKVLITTPITQFAAPKPEANGGKRMVVKYALMEEIDGVWSQHGALMDTPSFPLDMDGDDVATGESHWKIRAVFKAETVTETVTK